MRLQLHSGRVVGVGIAGALSAAALLASATFTSAWAVDQGEDGRSDITARSTTSTNHGGDDLANQFLPMRDQTYALCAGAIAFNFDGVTYAKCRLKNGNSVAASHIYPGGDALTVNKLLTSNRSMVSTYSPPNPKSYALYKCEPNGAYAQCNGGLCYRYNGEFPGVGKVGPNEVMCSCPISYETKTYHVTGPAQCPATRAAYDEICGSGTRADVTADGTILHIGADGPPSATIDGLNGVYDSFFGTRTPTPPTCERPAN